jgi:prepilin-type N-terminal cleavage/methylation domain-containing protein
MMGTVLLNNKGVTLIEMMISLVILLIVSLALMQSALLGMSTNVENSLRDEAVNVAEMRMNQLVSLPFTDAIIAPGLLPTPPVAEADISRKLRNAIVIYTPTRTITDLNADSKQITISVAWSYKGQRYTHGTMSIMRKQQ